MSPFTSTCIGLTLVRLAAARRVSSIKNANLTSTKWLRPGCCWLDKVFYSSLRLYRLPQTSRVQAKKNVEQFKRARLEDCKIKQLKLRKATDKCSTMLKLTNFI